LYLLKKGEKIDKAEMSDDKEYFVSVGEQGKVDCCKTVLCILC